MEGNQSTRRSLSIDEMFAQLSQTYNLDNMPAVPRTDEISEREPQLVSPSILLPANGQIPSVFASIQAPVGLGMPSLSQPSTEQPMLAKDQAVAALPPAILGASSVLEAATIEPITVAPSDLLASLDAVNVAPEASIEERLVNTILPGLGSADGDSLQRLHSQATGLTETHFDEILVTLPMASNVRQRYLKTIDKNTETMRQFSAVFTKSCSQEPEPQLVHDLETIFKELLDLCDLPAFGDTLPSLDMVALRKHATNTNSKLAFLYELLRQVSDLPLRVLLLSANGLVSDCLEAVATVPGVQLARLGRDEIPAPAESEGLSVILAHADQDLTQILDDITVVIPFDDQARALKLPSTLGAARKSAAAPLVMSPVVGLSLEHIAHELPPEPQGLAAKNCLIFALAEARELMRCAAPLPEPHEAAKIIAAHLRDRETPLQWEPLELAPQIFDCWLSSQAEPDTLQQSSHQGKGRKRILVSCPGNQ